MNQVSKQSGSVIIVGGGIGAMQAALDLADSGFKVHLVQKDSSLGGTMLMLDKTFPTGDCAMCMISPRMVEIGRHSNIDIYSLAQVSKISGEPGNFKANISLKPRYVDPEKCTGCGICDQKCPKLVSNPFDQGLGKRKAIYSLISQAVPNTRVIDRENCLYFQRGRCKACEKFCPSEAINFEDQGREIELNAGAIILAPGLNRYDAGRHQELGFGRWPNVISSLQFERILSASGPFRGEVKRPGDKKHLKKIAWIQCVGSRDSNQGNPWCSSVCCMYATKQAVIAKEHDQAIEPTIFYAEMRTFGKDFDKYVQRARDEYGVRYQRAFISQVYEEAGSGDLLLRYARQDGSLTEEKFDMVVLSIGLEPHSDALEFAQIFGIEPNAYGFAQTSPFSPIQTSRPGILVSGTYQGPKDIPESVIQGSAAAGKAMALLGEARGTEIAEKELPPERDTSRDEVRVGVLVCHCGVNISQTVDIEQVIQAVKDLPQVAYAGDLMYACSQDSQENIKKLVQEQNLNRVVVASCTPRTHQPLFQETIRDAGLNKYLFELADIREQCSWCHMGHNQEATQKAIDIIKMTVAKARNFEPVQTDSVQVLPSALIIGAGIAGLTSALALGDQGFEVHLVEKEERPGGLAKNVYRTLEGSDVQAFLSETIDKVVQHPRINLYTNAEVKKTDGFVGNFKTTLTDSNTLEHGAIVIATGGIEYQPTEYSYTESEAIITQRDLEKRLETEDFPDKTSFAMIQCVGSREEPNNYCSRVCCQDAIKNAIKIKNKYPKAQVTVFYRDLRTYGLREDYYQQARNLGVLFVRFEPEQKPEVSLDQEKINIRAYDYLLNKNILIRADYLALSTGLRPHPSTQEVGQKYKLTTNPEGYFLEAHVKLQPVDFPGEGIFVAGLAHAPKNLDETVSQALAAAGRAGVLLSHDRLSVSGIISKHNRDICMSCLACFRVCPYDSPYIDEEGRISHNEVKCMGCGICAGICPAKAFQVNNFRDDQITAMIDAIT